MNTGVGCHFLLQGIFPTWGSNLWSPESPALQADCLLLSHRKPSFHHGITQNPSFNTFSVITLRLKQKLWLASSIHKAKAQNPFSRLLLPSPTLLPLHPGVAREALEFTQIFAAYKDLHRQYLCGSYPLAHRMELR